IPVLEASDQLPLGDRQERNDHEDAQEDDDRLDHHHPGRLDVVDVGERDHLFSTLIRGAVPLASTLALPSSVPSIRNAAPRFMRSRTATVASTEWPLTDTLTSSPCASSMPSASSAASSSFCSGMRNRSAGLRLVTSLAQRSR